MVGVKRSVATALVLAGLAFVPTASALAPSGVKTTAAFETEPAAAPGYFAWVQNSRRHPYRYDVFVTPAGGTTFRVNARRTDGSVFGGAIDGHRLVYTQYSRSGAADLKLFNLLGRNRSSPAGVNTRYSENGASLSAGWLLFRRTSFATSTERIILHKLDGSDDRLLARTEGRAYAQPGTLAWPWATWYTCATFARCRAHRYDVRNGNTLHVPNPRDRSQYAVSATDNGTVFFAEAGNSNCGAGRGLWTFRPGVGRKRLLLFGTAQDPAITSALVMPDGATKVFYDRYNCSTGSSDIYKVVAPGRSDLSLAMSASDPAPDESDDVAFLVTVANAGPTTAKAVTVTNAVPAGMQFVSAPGCSQSSGLVSCKLGSVGVGATPQVTITLKACSAGPVTNTATVAGGWVDPKAANDAASAPLTVGDGPACPP